MATKNQVAQIIWIIEIIKIPQAKSSIQSDLSERCKERVGIESEEPKNL